MTEQQQSDLTAAIRAKVASGLLPREAPVKFWAGYGSGKICDACGLAISLAGIEHEVDMADRRTFRFHAACLGLWHQERAHYMKP